MQPKWSRGIRDVLTQACSITLCCFAPLTPARSQIIGDRTLGTEGSIVTPNITIKGILSDQIDGGAIRGSSLFHSFSEFNISRGRGAYFTNPAGIENIFSRVTGSTPSNIQGTLGVLGNANLFLLNPNGIIFGRNARLDLRGSFVASTANAIKFADGTFFSATDSSTSPLLTISMPVGLQYRSNAGSIQVQGSTLTVPDGETLALVGGAIALNRASLRAPGGRVELGGLADTGTIELNVNGSNLQLSFPDDVARADVALDNQAEVNVRAGGGGSIAINAQTLNMTRESSLKAGIDTGLGSLGSTAGDIEINATQAINLTDNSFIFNSVADRARGNGGNITLKTASLALTNGAQVGTITLGRGNAGSVVIEADDLVSVAGTTTGIFSSVESILDSFMGKGRGDSGGITIVTKTLSLTDGAQIVASTYGQGNAGSISVQADAVSLTGTDTAILSTVELGARGNSGGIAINTNSLSLANGAQLNASTIGRGNAGRVSIQANDWVSLSGEGTAIFSSVGFPELYAGVGDSEGIAIEARTLSLTEGAHIIASTFGRGNAGNISVRVDDSVSMLGGPTKKPIPSQPIAPSEISKNTRFVADVGEIGATTGIFSTVESRAEGNAGNIEIQSRSLILTNGAEVQSLTRGRGNAGNIVVNVADSVTFSGVAPGALFDLQGQINPVLVGGFSSGLISATEQNATGQGGDIYLTTSALRLSDGAVLNARTKSPFKGGNITVNTNTLELTGGGQLIVTAFGEGNAGNITVNAASRLTVSGSDRTYNERLAQFGSDIVDNVSPASGLFANTVEQSTGIGGNLKIATGELNIRDEAQISVDSQGLGNAGNLEITAQSIRLNNSATLSAETKGGQGNINIRSEDLVLRHGSKISTNAEGTNVIGGNITIDTGVLVALENSDITANSSNFRGGNVRVSASGIFGTKFRPTLTPKSDITASGANSEFSGTVQINTPEVDPTQGLVTLPQTVVDPTAFIAQNPCDRGKSSEFVVTGRGGLPSNPSHTLSDDNIQVGLVEPASSADNSSTKVTPSPTQVKAERIVPAQGWVFNAQGEVVLTADNPTSSEPQRPWVNPAACSDILSK